MSVKRIKDLFAYSLGLLMKCQSAVYIFKFDPQGSYPETLDDSLHSTFKAASLPIIFPLSLMVWLNQFVSFGAVDNIKL